MRREDSPPKMIRVVVHEDSLEPKMIQVVVTQHEESPTEMIQVVAKISREESI